MVYCKDPLLCANVSKWLKDVVSQHLVNAVSIYCTEPESTQSQEALSKNYFLPLCYYVGAQGITGGSGFRSLNSFSLWHKFKVEEKDTHSLIQPLSISGVG